MKQKHPTLTLTVLLLLALLAAGYFAYRSMFAPEALKRREVAKWVEIIGGSVELPRGEKPTLATVTNEGRLDDQAFFREAKNGDKILIYPRAAKAYLYRPGTGKLVGMTTDVDIEKDR
ncbi:MAG: hypothetical protein KBD19_03975 [Candidatus Moranbacteria bacterium]|nr:hypothetical protein [Candidatus Moranbacteria bacterium]